MSDNNIFARGTGNSSLDYLADLAERCAKRGYVTMKADYRARGPGYKNDKKSERKEGGNHGSA